ncbi:hypothetical protein [Gorillibacterium sp. CAU 1737]|uniref:hypothetical protein n=1 Tax=Gorillibacterium sp. CAU 1737 TaxID=3140362 RepID=UPI00326103DA
MTAAEKILNARPVECAIKGEKCCHIGCSSNAEYAIVGPRGYGYDDSYACSAHVEEYVNEEDVVELI